MRDVEIVSVLERTEGISAYTNPFSRETGGVWFVFQAGRLPHPDEIGNIVCDIDRNTPVGMYPNGELYHSNNCDAEEHKLRLSLSRCLPSIDTKEYTFALFESDIQSIPKAVCLSEWISLYTFPDHPHCNALRVEQAPDRTFHWDSICYCEKLDELGTEYPGKILAAIDQIRLYAIRHKIWLATRQQGNAIWIGPGVDMKMEEQFLFFRNPDQGCRCGKMLKYKHCHLVEDFKNAIHGMYPELMNGYALASPIMRLNARNDHLLHRYVDNGHFNFLQYQQDCLPQKSREEMLFKLRNELVPWVVP